MGQNIIFLDVDGPLLPQKMHWFHENRTSDQSIPPKFDAFSVRAFNLWAKYGNAKIVFSTNWACSFDDDELKEMMKANGLGFDYHEVVTTPKRMRSERYTEITSWLADNSSKGDVFIAVDDDQSCAYIEDILAHEKCEIEATGEWINIDFVNGMTVDNFTDGCRVLGIDIDLIREKEFGIKILSPEEKAKRDEAEELLMRSWI